MTTRLLSAKRCRWIVLFLSSTSAPASLVFLFLIFFKQCRQSKLHKVSFWSTLVQSISLDPRLFSYSRVRRNIRLISTMLRCCLCLQRRKGMTNSASRMALGLPETFGLRRGALRRVPKRDCTPSRDKNNRKAQVFRLQWSWALQYRYTGVIVGIEQTTLTKHNCAVRVYPTVRGRFLITTSAHVATCETWLK